MMTCPRAACLWAAAILSFAGHSASSECPAGSGLCRELQDEAPTSIGFVQFHADRAQPSHLAIQKQQAAESNAQLPDALTNLIPKPFKDYLSDVAAQGILTALDSSLNAIGNQVDSLQQRCTEYKTDIIGRINATISDVNATLSDKIEAGVGQLQRVVDARLVPISATWTGIINLFQGIGPPLVAGLKGLNLTTTAASVDHAYTDLMSAAQWISGVLANSTDAIGKLGNATEEEKEAVLQTLDALLDDGTTSVTHLTDNLAEMITQLLPSLTTMISDNTTIAPVQDKVDALAGKVGESLDTVISGTREAADLAVRGVQESAAAVLRVPLGLALACVGLGLALA